MDTVQWIKVLDKAFEKEDVGALKKVIGLLRAKLDDLQVAILPALYPAPRLQQRA
jgi:hypothetical protein